MNFRALLALVAVATPLFTTAQIFTDYSHGDGLTFQAKDSTFKTIISGRFQNRFSSFSPFESDFDTENIGTEFAIQRARLDINGYIYDPTITYKFELGFSQFDMGATEAQHGAQAQIIMDAYVNWNFYENFEVQFGQARLPGNRARVMSSQNLQLVDRSLVNDNYNLDRDLSLQLLHKIKLGNIVIKEAFAASQGDGRNIVSQNDGGYQYTARLDILPFGEFTNDGDMYMSDLEREESPKLAIGGVYDFNDNAVRERGNHGDFMATERDLQTIMADLLFKYNGFSFYSEFASRTAPIPVFYDRDTGEWAGAFNTGWGISAQAGYLLNSNWEAAGRFTYLEPEAVTQRPIQREYMLGFSKYISGHNLKVQGDGAYNVMDGGDDFVTFRLQVEVGF